MYEDLDQINYKISGNSITYIHNTGCDIKLTQCNLLRGSSFNHELIPKKFLKRYHTHELYKKVLFDDIKQSKCQYYKIVNKNGQLYTQLET